VPELAKRTKYDRVLPSRTAWLLGVNYALVVGATFVVLMWHHQIARGPLVLAALAILAAVFATGATIEGRRWAIGPAVGQLALAGAAIALWAHG